MMEEPIRVLCLFTIMDRGGAETMCMNIYRHIDRAKVQFDFLVYYPQKGQYDEEIKKLGGHIFVIPHLDIKNLYSHIKGARVFFSTHKEYQIIHNHMGENGAFICREAKKANIKTIIFHSHVDKVSILKKNDFYNKGSKTVNLPYSINKKDFLLSLLRPMALMNSSDYFACGTNASKIFQNKVREIQIVKNAINIDKYRYNKCMRIKKRTEMNCEEKLIIGNVARINENKNQTFAIEIMKEFIKSYPRSEMWFIGDGVLRSKLENTVKQEGLNDYIRFFGIRKDVNELMQAIDVFLFPSIKEGLPVSCIEAQAAGLPCVFSNGFDKATAVTDLCTTLSLKEPVEAWVKAIIQQSKKERIDTTEHIRNAGYDIHETAKYMEDFYLSKVKK